MSDEDDSKNAYHEHAQVTTTLDKDEVVDNEKEQVEHNERIEHHEKREPPTDPNLPNDMEVSTEAPTCVIAPLETHQEPKASSLEYLQEPSYVKILMDLCMQVQKSRNQFPKKILRSKQFYIRWRNILPKEYEFLKKKRWKGLVGHQYDRRKRYKVFDENQQASLKDPLHVLVGPITRVRFKIINEALSGLIQEIWTSSKTGHSNLGPKEDERVINLIQAIDGADLA